ncbi:MAG: cupin domain-containing protein, partial [Luteibacter sp.]
MTDPLADVVSLLQPMPTFSKSVEAAGRWQVTRSEVGKPFYCVILGGACRLVQGDEEAMTLREGDFVLIPEIYDFAMASMEPSLPDDGPALHAALGDGRFRLGRQDG